MVEADIKAAVELFSVSEGRYHYSIWRRSEYIVDFPVIAILRQLNIAEGLDPEATDGWGGSENVGGSPRGRGSALSPDEVERVVREAVISAGVRKWSLAPEEGEAGEADCPATSAESGSGDQ